jgi:hypothetical protein
MEPDPEPCGGFVLAAGKLLDHMNETNGLDYDRYTRLADTTSLLYEDLEDLAEDLNRLKVKKEESNDAHNSDLPSSSCLEDYEPDSKEDAECRSIDYDDCDEQNVARHAYVHDQEVHEGDHRDFHPQQPLQRAGEQLLQRREQKGRSNSSLNFPAKTSLSSDSLESERSERKENNNNIEHAEVKDEIKEHFTPVLSDGVVAGEIMKARTGKEGRLEPLTRSFNLYTGAATGFNGNKELNQNKFRSVPELSLRQTTTEHLNIDLFDTDDDVSDKTKGDDKIGELPVEDSVKIPPDRGTTAVGHGMDGVVVELDPGNSKSTYLKKEYVSA